MSICDRISDDIIERMSELLAESRELGKEVGMNICIPEYAKPFISGECIGIEDCILLPANKCHEKDELVTFHTHPSGFLMPSESDLFSVNRPNENAICIGSPVSKTVKCFELPKEGEIKARFIKARKNLIEGPMNEFDKISDDFHSAQKEVIKLAKKNFKKIRQGKIESCDIDCTPMKDW